MDAYEREVRSLLAADHATLMLPPDGSVDIEARNDERTVFAIRCGGTPTVLLSDGQLASILDTGSSALGWWHEEAAAAAEFYRYRVILSGQGREAALKFLADQIDLG